MQSDRITFVFLSACLAVLLALAVAGYFTPDYTLKPALINTLGAIILALIAGDEVRKRGGGGGENSG